MADAKTPLLPTRSSSSSEPPASAWKDAINLIGVFQGVMIVLFGVFTKYDDLGPNPNLTEFVVRERNYELYKDVAVMIFIGFGFLMTFLKKYGYGAVAYTLLVSCMCVEWTILNIGFWFNYVGDKDHSNIRLNIDMFIQGLFGAGAVMISFGALIGKVSPVQIALLSIFEIFFYSINNYLVSDKLKGVDEGGSIVIHTFGAYFGLTASIFLTPKKEKRDFKDGESCYHSDIFGFIGTVFLWIYWPSFNAYTVSLPYQERTVMNTILALLSSGICAFYVSWTVRGKHFDAVDIQNATLAGGVAIGTVASMNIRPFSALIVGGLAGTISVVGYKFFLNKVDQMGVHDTCGVHNLHGMPGMLGGLASILFAGIATEADRTDLAFPRHHDQWLYQLLSVLLTLGMAIVTGALSALIVKYLLSSPTFPFTDEIYWNIPTSDVTFTKDDINPEIKRRASARNDRGIRNWGKMRSAVNVARAFGGLKNLANKTSTPAIPESPSTGSVNAEGNTSQ